MENLQVVTYAPFNCRAFHLNDFGKKRKRIKLNSERMISDTKEVTVKPVEWLFVNTVFKRLDSGDVKILNRA